MDTNSKLELSKKLQNYNYLFKTFWDICNIRYDDSIETAGIVFNDTGDHLYLVLNKDFWESQTEQTKLFIIIHECFHCILNHGKRFKEFLNTSDFPTVNKAADIVINELILRSFDFDLDEIKYILDNGMFVDTVFDDPNISKTETTEYYLDLLLKSDIDLSGKGFDVHIFNPDAIDSYLTESEFFNNLDYLDPNIISTTGIESGTSDGLLEHSVTLSKIKAKKKWESVIKKWAIKNSRESIDLVDRWDRESPRYGSIINHSNIKLPSTNWIIDSYFESSKIEVFFYLDSSGSCIDLKDRFFNAARSLNPNKFKVRLFSFDIRVKELDITNPVVYGGGGTAFNIIESNIQKVISRDRIKYPKAVFIITDGWGNRVSPEFPNRWHWFLSENYTVYIPEESNIYKLSEFE